MSISPADETDLDELRRRLEEAEETLRAIRSGEVDALVVSSADGDRVFTLQGADHPYRTLIEAMQQGAVSLSDDGTVLYCNRRFAELMKTPHEKVIGAGIATFVTPQHQTIFESMLRQGHSQTSQGELQFQALDGSLLPVFVALAPLPLGEFAALCMVVTDLTEQKKHRDLEESSRRKDEFLAMLAHELRNPLAPIRNAVAILQQLGIPDEKAAYASEIIERQVHHLSRLVDDLLDVSRITLGKVKLRKEPVDLSAIVARGVETSLPALDARRQQLTLLSAPKPIRLEADPTRLAQIIGNLLTNAAKYTDENGKIVLATTREGSDAVIRVSDTGIGISAELLPHIFDLFTQGDRSLARSDGGLGIGLTLVRRLVELHGGTVEALSDGPGTGSQFVVKLPALCDEPLPVDPGTSVTKEFDEQTNRRVLIVEDNKDGADSLAMLLKLMGHEVCIAYNGTEALDAATAIQPHVILLDIGLPGMSGHEVAKQLRQQSRFATTQLIAMTGYGQEEDEQRSREAGFNHHLVKPVNLDVLKRLLESLESSAR